MGLWNAKKRILSLDGGGVRGVISLAFLERIERFLAVHYGTGDDFRLSDHFHLIGGTSTGAIIAAGLATGRSVASLKDVYFRLARRAFRRRLLYFPYLQAKFNSRHIGRILEEELGPITLDDPAIRTHLAIVTKRVDTGSPWIVSNLPGQPYWNDGPAHDPWHGNRHYRLSAIVRASTAAPLYFGPERIAISAQGTGTFIDGGVSPYNNPSLALLMLARMNTFGLGWPTGPDKLSIVSVGTGRFRRRLSPSGPAVGAAVNALLGLIDDASLATLILMQWLGASPAPAWINSEIGALENEYLAGAPLFSFQRYDADMEKASLEASLGRMFGKSEKQALHRLDNVEAMDDLYRVAREVAEKALPDPPLTEPDRLQSPLA